MRGPLPIACICLLLPLLIVAACNGDDDDTQTPPDHPEAHEYYLLGEYDDNHLLPLYAHVDPDGRSAWCVSRMLGTTAQVDLDTAELVQVLPRYSSEHAPTRIVGDGPDRAWQVRNGTPALLRIEAEKGTMRAVDAELTAASDVLRLDDDRLVVAGTAGNGGYALKVLDGELEVTDTVELEIKALQLEARDADTFGVMMQGGRVDLRNRDDLQLVGTCTAPFVGNNGGNSLAALDTGDFVVTDDTAVGIVSCDDDEPLEIVAGNENKDVVALGDEFVVLDRIGGTEPNWGEMRRYGAQLATMAGPFSTGKNSGYGGLDTVTGLVWMSSEGSTEMWAVDPETGDVAHRVQLGIHVESATADPARTGRVYVSGRLSDNLFWVDMTTGEQLTADLDFHWPVKPRVYGDRLWVVDHLDAVLYELDLDTLDVVAGHDLGLSTNVSLTLSDLAVHEARGTLLVTHGWDNVLVEVDPASGQVVSRWDLGGEVLDKDESGRLEVKAGPDRVFTVRSADGRITSIDPDLAEAVATAAPVESLVPESTRLQYAALAEDGSLLYVGPYAIDPDTLERVTGQDRTWTFAAAERDGLWVAWRADDSSVILVDGAGEIHTVLPTEIVAGAQAPELEWVPWWDGRLLYTDIRRAGVAAWPLNVD